MKIVVDTYETPHGVINQDITTILDSTENKMWSMVMDTRNKQVRDMLITMGWTPPKEAKYIYNKATTVQP